jgi:hypothetical protein
MEEEGSPIIDIVGDASKGPLPETLMTNSSSDASLLGVASDVAKAEAKVSVDSCELTRSYDFRASSVTVSHIRQLESLGYFAKVWRVSRGRRLCRSQTQTKLLSSKNFLLWDCGCRLILLSLRFYSNSGCSCINLP